LVYASGCCGWGIPIKFIIRCYDSRPMRRSSAFAAVLVAWLTLGAAAQPPAAPTPPFHAVPAKRLVIRNGKVAYGNPKPPFGPADIIVENGLITAITTPAIRDRADGDAVVIDATGKYVMPGIVNAHMHWHEERQPGIAQPIQYERNLYL